MSKSNTDSSNDSSIDRCKSIVIDIERYTK